MNTFLWVYIHIPLWMLIPCLILVYINYLTEPKVKTEEDYWKEDGYYKSELGIWEKKSNK